MSKAAAKYSDLTRSEGAPTARADVDLPLQFEKIKIKGGIGAATGQMEVQTHIGQKSALEPIVGLVRGRSSAARVLRPGIRGCRSPRRLP